MKTLTLIQHRAPIYARAAVRLTIAAAVLIGCILADLTALSYELGRQTGAAVHARNDQLAALAVRLLAPAPAPVAPVATEPAPAPAPTVAECAIDAMRATGAPADTLATLGAMMMSPPEPPLPVAHSLTVRELRALTGRHSKRLKKSDLVSCAVANGLARMA